MGYAAILVDSRPQTGLNQVIDAHRRYLPAGWDCLIFTCAKNNYVERNGVRRVDIDEKTTDCYEKVSSFLASPWIWDQLKDYERVLLFQQDSKLLRNGIEEFLEWDWIGAPWKFCAPWRIKRKLIGKRVGNGGLSIRNPKLLLNITRSAPWDGRHEDVFFVRRMKKFGGRIAPVEAAKKFSCETIFALGTVGCHAIERYFSNAQVRMILEQYARPAVAENMTSSGELSLETSH
jgi:hypothetical protein